MSFFSLSFYKKRGKIQNIFAPSAMEQIWIGSMHTEIILVAPFSLVIAYPVRDDSLFNPYSLIKLSVI